MTQQETSTRAPSVTLQAIGHGRKIKVDDIGVPAVLICVGRETSSQARPVVEAVRAKYPTVADVVIANIADVRGFPRMLRKVAEQLMKSSYKDAVEGLDPGKTPEEYVLILPDWDGDVLTPLGVEDVSKQIAVAVIDADATLIGVYQGDDPASHAVELMEKTKTAV
jgi:hypothetical protein